MNAVNCREAFFLNKMGGRRVLLIYFLPCFFASTSFFTLFFFCHLTASKVRLNERQIRGDRESIQNQIMQ